MTRADKQGRLIDLPVQYMDGKWETVLGGEVLVRNGTYATLQIREKAIEPSPLKAALEREIVVKVLDEGTVLHAALSLPSRPQCAPSRQIRIPMDPRYWPGERLTFVPIKLGPPSRRSLGLDYERGGLWMHHTGLDKCELIASQVLLFADGDTDSKDEPFEAESLNHAFTVLSEKYERDRISHTGSVYERFFYQEKHSGDWFPLLSLRDGVRDRAMQAVVAAAWEQIEKEIGWCRLPPLPKKPSPRVNRRDSLFGTEWEDDT